MSVLGDKCREILHKEASLCGQVAVLFGRMWWLPMSLSFLFLLLLAGAGLLTSFHFNQDADDFMAPVDTVYYQRLLKYRPLFPMNTSYNYQGHWMMQGLGMYLNVVMVFPEDQTAKERRFNVAAMNAFYRLVEGFKSSSNKTFPDVCAMHEALYFWGADDYCYRMDLTRTQSRNKKKRDLNLSPLLKDVLEDGDPIEFPSMKDTALVGMTTTYVVPVAEVFGSSFRRPSNLSAYSESDSLEPFTCEKQVSKSGQLYNFKHSACMQSGKDGERVEALRYAWHLRYDTEEEMEESRLWLDEVADKCKEFEADIRGRKAGGKKQLFSPNVTFMCYKSTSIADGAKLAISDDLKFVLAGLLLSLLLPCLFAIKVPCGSSNWLMLSLICLGLFFFALVVSLGIGALVGFELIYSFVVTTVFAAWMFFKLCMYVMESLKDHLPLSVKFSDTSSFEWLFSYWTPIALSNSVTLSATCFLVCSSMYKLVWCTAGIFGVFFLVSFVVLTGILLPAISLILKSRDRDGNPCCMGKSRPLGEGEAEAHHMGLLAVIKTTYKKVILDSGVLVKLMILAPFAVLFIVSLVISVGVLVADQTDPSFYGYDRREIVQKDDNVHYMLDVLTKYYPNNGPLVQLIFNEKAKFYNDIGNGSEEACNKSHPKMCLFHNNLLYTELFPYIWNETEDSWPLWSINWFTSHVLTLNDQGEYGLDTPEILLNKFVPSVERENPWYPLYLDMYRLFFQEENFPALMNEGEYHKEEAERVFSSSAGNVSGDPYTRIYLRQKYLTHTAREVKFLQDLEAAQQSLATDASPELQRYFPSDSFEYYSNLFLYYEQSRDILPRTFVLPSVLVGGLLVVLVCSALTLPHPLAHLAVFLNLTMLFFECFAIQTLLGTTVNNFSMAYYFLIYAFAIDCSLVPVHNNLKYLLLGPTLAVPPSPLPALCVLVGALLAFLLLLAAPLSSLVALSVRNCVFVFGVVGMLHELLFVPALMGLLIPREEGSQEEERRGVAIYTNGTQGGGDDKGSASVVMRASGDKEGEASA